MYVCTTIERYYWNDFVSGHDNVLKGIKALVDLHVPNYHDHILGIKEVRAAISETYLSLSSISIDQYRSQHAFDLDINFVIDKLYEDFLKVYESMPSSSEVMKDSTLTLLNASPMLSEIMSNLEGDQVNNQNFVALRYIHHFAELNINSNMLSNRTTKKRLSERFDNSFQNIMKSDCFIGDSLRNALLSELLNLDAVTSLPLRYFIGPLLSLHVLGEPLKILNSTSLAIFGSSNVTSEEATLVIYVINDFIMTLYSEPEIDAYEVYTLDKKDLLSLRKSLELASNNFETAVVNYFFTDLEIDESDDRDDSFRL
jgi:hypothetical protein